MSQPSLRIKVAILCAPPDLLRLTQFGSNAPNAPCQPGFCCRQPNIIPWFIPVFIIRLDSVLLYFYRVR